MSAGLELSYRRLLALFPERHRRVYEEEMVGVLLASAGPDQRRPRPGEALNLALTGLRLRLGRWGSGLGDRRWSAAAAVFGFVGAVALMTRAVAGTLLQAVWAWRTVLPAPDLSFFDWAWMGGWLAVVVAVLAGGRVVGAVGAWVVVVVQVVWVVRSYPDSALGASGSLPVLMFGVLVAAALSVRNPRRAALRTLGRRRAVWLAAAVLLTIAGPMIDPLLARVHHLPGGGYVLSLGPGDGGLLPNLRWFGPYPDFGLGLAALLTFVAVLGIGLAITIGLESGVRRRVLALVAAPGLLAVGIDNTFLYAMAYSGQRVLLVAVVVLVPVLTLLVGSAMVQALDRREELIALGRTVERQATGA